MFSRGSASRLGRQRRNPCIGSEWPRVVQAAAGDHDASRDAAGNRTAYDALLGFCSTIGTKAGSSEYYFARNNARSSTADYTARNKALYEYLQALTQTNVPGFGGNFLAKYQQGSGPNAGPASDRDQILTYICDYIRSTNLQDRSTLPSGSRSQVRGSKVASKEAKSMISLAEVFSPAPSV